MQKLQIIKLIKVYQCGHSLETEEEFLMQEAVQKIRSGKWHYLARHTYQVFKSGPCPDCYVSFLDLYEKKPRLFRK